jgi:hypothetical protein
MTTINQTEDLRSKIFGICENLYKNNEKVTREAVREHLGGGSFSTISPLVSEWKKVKKVQFEEKEGTNPQIINAESSEIIEILKELKTALINTEFITDKEIENVIRFGAEKATGLMIVQDAVATYFYQNPHRLPADLKAQLEEMKENFSQSRSAINKAAYNPQNLINLAMKKINQQKNNTELID